jgi:ribonuclease-3
LDREAAAVTSARPAPCLDEALGYRFEDPELAETALSHPSYAHELDGSRGNERLEFLGDAVLGMVVAHRLYEANPQWAEGQLTPARAALVNKHELAERARALGLGPFIKLGRTEQLSAGADKDSILADCFEAVVGAIYLDGGLERAAAFLDRVFGSAIAQQSAPPVRDPKTRLNELSHARFQSTPRYRTVIDTGIQNDDARFTVQVLIDGEPWGRGVGRSKQVAERAAAATALASEKAAGD